MERLLRCKRCGRDFPASDLRISPDGGWICRGCLAGNPVIGQAPLRAFDEHMKRQEGDLSGLTTYKCRCGYVIRQRRGEQVKRCPYCGRDASAFKKEVSAQDLLDDAEE
ncbi:hypothetical protein JXA12_00945 [Candidatus Woesearchaeota archaeon]|nr:hypothetical protein [Candidatus Woesearchaeota archaeon]